MYFLKRLNAETWVRSLAWEDPLAKGKATHSSILAWRIPWSVKSMGLQRVGHNWAISTHSVVKNPPANVGDLGDAGSIPGSGRSPGGGNGKPLQCSPLENPMYGGAWRATVRGVWRGVPTPTSNSQTSPECPIIQLIGKSTEVGCHCLLQFLTRGSIRYPRLGTQSHRTPPASHFIHQQQVQVISCVSDQLTTNWASQQPPPWVSDTRLNPGC